MKLTETQHEYILSLGRYRIKMSRLLELGPEAVQDALERAREKEKAQIPAEPNRDAIDFHKGVMEGSKSLNI